MGINTLGENNYFQDAIVFDKEMTREAAINDMAIFHNTSHKRLLKTFGNLGKLPCKKIRFELMTNKDYEYGSIGGGNKHGVFGGEDTIIMYGLKDNGNIYWSSHIDPITGEPRNRV